MMSKRSGGGKTELSENSSCNYELYKDKNTLFCQITVWIA